MRPLDKIIVHCAATRPSWWASKSGAAQVREIKRWHVTPKPGGRGWRDIGYHYLIDRKGNMHVGRPLGEVGAHVLGQNTGSIGICLIGGHGSASTDMFEDHFTEAQDGALQALILHLQKDYGALTLHGHNEYANKGCPGFDVRTWWASRLHTVPAPKNWFEQLIAAIIAAFTRRKS